MAEPTPALAGGRADMIAPVDGGHGKPDAGAEQGQAGRWLRSQVQDIGSELAGTGVAGTAASSARVQSR